ncbi:hypothetical protein PMI22_05169 [Pseudomonas sp. GM21]|jgi:hypothetical protein|uniref:hypothetical protein n=1 Tax=Pseudomonas TaxID=286 RepID=UPI0002722994|nr:MULTISPECIES: hypothetical protein [Pseudomonas]EJM12887.1 hypothetical protein PMI22_05169 [Pseudomonas sp. GM21]MDR7283022.1 hypothetical protein [Pseudomonas corrugata]
MSTSESRPKKKGILLADAPSVDDVPDSDPDGRLPANVLLNGGQARVPRWPIYADQPGEMDELTVFWRRDGRTIEIYKEIKNGPITEKEFLISIGTHLLLGDGVAFLYYMVKPIPGNRLFSVERKLTIDHSVIPLPVLLEPTFPDANGGGYLNCGTERAIWDGLYIKIPYQNLEKDDVCVLFWQGYTSLNGADKTEITGTEGEFSYTLSDEDAKNINGFELPPIVFVPFVEPVVYGSGTARYKIRRAGEFVGESKKGLVRIDRIEAGEENYCGPE